MKKWLKTCWPVLFLLVWFQVPAWSGEGGQDTPTPSLPNITGGQNEKNLMTDIHDIREPQQWGADPVWIKYGIICLFVIIIIMIVIWAIIRWRKKTDIKTLIPEISPEDTAYTALAQIKDLMEIDGRTYYFRLSEILRKYIGKRFEIDALEMTSEELIPEVMALDMDPALKKNIRELFFFSDPVKFAAKHADISQMKNHYNLVINFVDKTTPKIPDFEHEITDDEVLKKKLANQDTPNEKR